MPGMVALLNFTVSLLLIYGTSRLCGYPCPAFRAVLASALGALHAGACLLPGFGFLGNALWRLVFLGLMAWFAFGTMEGAMHRWGVFLLLNMALSGVVLGLGDGSIWSVFLAAIGVLIICAIGFRNGIGTQRFVPVELTYKEQRVCLTALRDTGNTLRDPLTGRQVLVVDAQTALKLTGLSAEQLKKPVESVTAIPGLRLIPYRTVGREAGLMLALKLPQVKIGTWQGSTLVAFAPEGLGNGTYQALTGGAV